MSGQGLNIVFITSSIGYGGASKMLCFVAESLAQRGHNVFVCNISSTCDTVEYRRTIEGAEVFDIKEIDHVGRVKAIKSIVKRVKADVIISFTEMPNIYAKIVGLLCGIPSIMSERGDPERTNGKRGLKNKIAVFIQNRSKGGVFQTDGARQFFGRGLRKRGVVIPNPIFVKGKIPVVEHSERQKSVVSVGRLDNDQRRYDVMLDAFKLFSTKHPEYVLKLYGKGSDEELIKQWVIDKGLSQKVKFMGLTTEPMQDIARDGMFIITSDYEGISNSLLEAMAVGLPCVSTDHTPGGARLLIQDGVNGLLAPIADAEKLAGAMCKFAENDDLAKSCGNEAKKVLERFAPSKIIDMWEQYILKVVGDK